jgi:monothiol glutaredoxin
MSDKAREVIQKEVASHPVILYMKGTPDFPKCGFSARATQALKTCGVPFAAVNVFEDEETYRQGIKDFSNWPTIPQLYIGGEFMGGSDIIIEMYQSGELEKTAKSAIEKHQGTA